MLFFGVVFWIVWLVVVGVSFAVLETLGILHKGPTLSTVWKRWEDGKTEVRDTTIAVSPGGTRHFDVGQDVEIKGLKYKIKSISGDTMVVTGKIGTKVRVKGVFKWTMFRVVTLLSLIGLSQYLIIHWVAERW